MEMNQVHNFFSTANRFKTAVKTIEVKNLVNQEDLLKLRDFVSKRSFHA